MINVRAKLWRVALELLQQFPVAGIRQQLAGPGILLQLLVQVGHRKRVHHRFLWQVKKQVCMLAQFYGYAIIIELWDLLSDA